jgi:outer membrane protein TolC
VERAANDVRDAELGLAQAQLNELLGLVSIYRNLGGGWQEQ